MNSGIHIQNLHKSFRSGEAVTPVLKGIDLDIPRGEMFFIVGPSGCGKTTLISVLCGTLNADQGVVNVFGNNLTAMSEKKITQFRANHVGFVFQQFNLIPTLTASQNIAIPLRLQGKSASASIKAACEMMERVGLADKINEFPRKLSGGQQQRVAIARALVHQPSLIVCDEPTSAIDSETGKLVMELLCPQRGETERTVIVVTHDPRIYHFANRIAEMEDGVIQRTLSTADYRSSSAYHSYPQISTP